MFPLVSLSVCPCSSLARPFHVRELENVYCTIDFECGRDASTIQPPLGRLRGGHRVTMALRCTCRIDYALELTTES